MAIQKGTIIVRGKIGNIVGMKNGFGTKKEGFARSYVAEIANPQTTTQMNQRAKMLPAVLFRRQLAEVIARAWEGKKYGGQSIREFMKYALKEPWTNVPQLVKDSAVAIPGAYLISKGSLATIGVVISNGSLSISLPTGTAMDGTATIGDLSAALLAGNAFLRAGDQLTLVVAVAPSASIPYVVYHVKSIYLNEADESTINDWAGSALAITSDSNTLAVAAAETGHIILGGSIVLSREGNNSNQRSTQRFVLNTTALTTYFASALKASIAETYKNAASSRSTTDWPYEDSEADESTGGNTPSVERVAVNVTVSPSGAGSATGGGSKAIGSTCNLMATAEDGYTFDGWKINGVSVSSSNPYSFEVTEAVNVVAQFRSADDPGEDRP